MTTSLGLILGFILGCVATVVTLYVIGMRRQRRSFNHGVNSVVNHGEDVVAVLKKEGGHRYAYKGK